MAFADVDVGEEGANIIHGLMPLMARRGPDDEGVWSDGKRVTLGFRRLAVLDLSDAGHQPMLTQDGRYALVFNGELYNFSEIRRELEQEGVRFRSTGDAEVVLYALVRWGTRVLSRFNGMFALGFYDSLEKRLLLIRDHAGIKPLYYLLAPRGLVFASQYDQIIAHSWSRSLAVAADALGLYLRLGYIPAPYALFQNTHMLEPGTWLEITQEGRVSRGTFFDFPVYLESDLRGEEACEAVDAAVTAAVRRQLVSDVPVGAFLSGGIDSPLVTAKMSAVYEGKVHAFTLGTNGDPLDESADANAYAQEIGVDHWIEHLTPGKTLEMLTAVVDACGEPFADYSVFPTMLVSRIARRHVKVMLSGDGGDELFWGYAGRFGSVLEKVNAFNESSEQSRWNLKKLVNAYSGADNSCWPKSIGDIYRLKHSHIPEGWLRRILPDVPDWPADSPLFAYSGWELDRTAQWLRWNEWTTHLTGVLLKVDRASMYHSLEVRVPLLDKEVVELAARVDWRSCLDIERRIGKWPLRYSLARHVRRQTWSKRGFTFSIGACLKGPLRPIFEDVVLRRKEVVGLRIDTRAARELFELNASGKFEYGYGLWVLLSLALWEDRHLSVRNAAA